MNLFLQIMSIYAIAKSIHYGAASVFTMRYSFMLGTLADIIESRITPTGRYVSDYPMHVCGVCLCVCLSYLIYLIETCVTLYIEYT